MPCANGSDMTAHTLQELATFLLCEELTKLLEAKTATGKVAGDFRFCNQVNDAALDAAADVAEGFARYYPGEFARFLDYAIASLAEVRARVEAGFRRAYFTAETTSDLLHLCARADSAARRLRRYLWSVKKSDLSPRPDRSEAARIAQSLRSRRRGTGGAKATAVKPRS
jgi:four helix bundle protein